MTTIAPAPDTVQVFGREIEYKWIVAVVYVSALFLDILDSTIVNVAIPGLGRELRTENAEWVVLGYTLSLAVWIPTSGWLGDRFGTKRTFLIARQHAYTTSAHAASPRRVIVPESTGCGE